MTRTKVVKPETNPDASDAEPELSFEATLERLHQIVERLEGGELDLEESLRLFEQGVSLSRISQARLNAAEKRVEELLLVTSDGEPVVRELDFAP